ncbi:MAG: hypothetical protein K2X74_09975 [Acetobacteraceae bacterium]|nr:hypothetical protein [Acetobacteraceae bacterium]
MLHLPVLVLLWFAPHAVDLRLVALPWLYQSVQFVLGGALCCPVAHLCYRLVELPGIALGSSLLANARPAPGPTPPVPPCGVTRRCRRCDRWGGLGGTGLGRPGMLKADAC